LYQSIARALKMKIIFTDTHENIYFRYHDSIPGKVLSKPRLNLTLLHMYAMYRNVIFDSYEKKPDLADDIKNWEMQFRSKEKDSIDDDAHLYHYCVSVSLGAMREWKNPISKMQCYMAYEEIDGKTRKIGFVHFSEKEIEGKKIVYIAHAGVERQGCGLGRRLMECVLSHYPAGTEFHICTRIFNAEAKILYQNRLKFEPMDQEEAHNTMGIDKRYCGFKKVTTQHDIEEIVQKFRNETKRRSSLVG